MASGCLARDHAQFLGETRGRRCYRMECAPLSWHLARAPIETWGRADSGEIRGYHLRYLKNAIAVDSQALRPYLYESRVYLHRMLIGEC